MGALDPHGPEPSPDARSDEDAPSTDNAGGGPVGGDGALDLGDPKADATDEPESPEQELTSAASP